MSKYNFYPTKQVKDINLLSGTPKAPRPSGSNSQQYSSYDIRPSNAHSSARETNRYKDKPLSPTENYLHNPPVNNKTSTSVSPNYTYEAEIQNKFRDLGKQIEESKLAFQVDLETTNRKFHSVKKYIDGMKQEIEKLRDEVLVLRNENNLSMESINTLKNSINTRQTSEVIVPELFVKKEDFDAAMQNMTKHMQSLRSKLASQSQSEERLEKPHSSSEAVRPIQQQPFDQSELMQFVKNLEKENKTLKEKLQVKGDDLQVKNLEKENKTLKEKLQVKGDDLQVRHLENENQKLTEKLQEKEEELQAKISAVASIKERLKTSSSTNTVSYKRELNSFKHQMEDYKTKLEVLTKQNQALEEVLEVNKKENFQLKKDNSNLKKLQIDTSVSPTEPVDPIIPMDITENRFSSLPNSQTQRNVDLPYWWNKHMI